jgi:hypothetical protein
VEPIGPEAFDEIFRRVLRENGLPFEASTAADLRSLCESHQKGIGLKACYPRDIFEILAALAQYKRQPFQITREALRIVTDMYFTHEYPLGVPDTPKE